ncbi:uncharacterized protein LOC129989460 [Argiope bruennichi]|uniref:uncharacterized protein LOC129989460 n=1 Tax=Argiope bruennichi TaxID=94029 RepID=UPI002494DF24|nr:uncharacterized protein LOC129989460 [Argiope bruennichi]
MSGKERKVKESKNLRKNEEKLLKTHVTEDQQLSAQKYDLIMRLKNDLESCQENIEEIKTDREKLFSMAHKGAALPIIPIQDTVPYTSRVSEWIKSLEMDDIDDPISLEQQTPDLGIQCEVRKENQKGSYFAAVVQIEDGISPTQEQLPYEFGKNELHSNKQNSQLISSSEQLPAQVSNSTDKEKSSFAARSKANPLLLMRQIRDQATEESEKDGASFLERIMSSRKARGRGTTKKRAQRATSNVFAMFDQAQIQEFKEAFNMIDQNRDGFIDKDDLHDMLASLGKNPEDDFLEGMMKEAPGPINFTMFLTLFGERLQGTDPEDVIKNAFACFDEENSGRINEERLRELLTTMGDRFTDEDVDEMYREAPIDKNGMFDYLEFTRILKHGAKEKDDQ